MRFTTAVTWEKRPASDLVVVPFWETDKGAEIAVRGLPGELAKSCATPIDLKDFTGAEGSVFFVYQEAGANRRIALLGLGKKAAMTAEIIRRCYAALVLACRQKNITSLTMSVPLHDVLEAVCEGLLLANYEFLALKRQSLHPSTQGLLTSVCFVGLQARELSFIKDYQQIARAVYWVRDLVNGNAEDVTPQVLAQHAKQLARNLPHTKCTLLSKRQLQKLGFGLLLAVNQGSPRDPAFMVLEYHGNRKSHDHTVLVGKGITYDTGGVNLKITGDMEEMKCDMAGGATVLGTIYAVASLGLKVNVTAVVPSTENCIDGRSYKQGDVFVGYSGMSVEVGNTDAEGRLILADALSYAVKNLKPTRIIDVATLTGGVIIALGKEVSGLMSTDDELARALTKAGEQTYERVWRLPLVEEYRKKLKSDVADIRSIGGRPGSAILAALFLREFIEKVPWAHLDIAGTAFTQEPHGYTPKYATGYGVRLLTQFIKGLE